MEHPGALCVLVRVVEAGSSSAVARARAAVAQPAEHLGFASFIVRAKNPMTHDGQMLLGLARPVLYGVDGMESALGLQRASSVGLVRVGVTVAGRRFLARRLPTLLADHPDYKSNSQSAIGSAT